MLAAHDGLARAGARPGGPVAVPEMTAALADRLRELIALSEQTKLPTTPSTQLVAFRGQADDFLRDHGADLLRIVEGQNAVHDGYVRMCALLYRHRKDGEDEIACLARIVEESERDREDAARYRWLREGRPGTYDSVLIYAGRALDVAIDKAAARASGGDDDPQR